MYVIIDNYDSFTYNLFQYVAGITKSEVKVFRNDKISIGELEELSPKGIIISPGPGRPEDAGISIEVVKFFAGKIPILGVCLGHQVIGFAYGARIIAAKQIVHGKTDNIKLDGHGLFRNLLSPAKFTRYHSLVIDSNSIPQELEVTAISSDGEVMGIRHRELLIEGVQFHPESIASNLGMQLLSNFVNYKRMAFEFTPLLSQVMEGNGLSLESSSDLMDEITEGRLSESKLSAILVALSMKGYTPQEIAGFASVLKRKKEKILSEGKIVDTCGTGGDGLSTFNISSMSAIVAAASGAKVAKHGNRGVSSPTGSAEFYEALGIRIEMNSTQAALLLEQVGFTFLFAPLYHSAMRHAAVVRRDLGIKTLMNLLGPLVNPAEAKYQLIGVYDGKLCEKMAHASILLGAERVLAVHGDDGQDEISVTSPSRIVEANGINDVKTYEFLPTDCGIELTSLVHLKGGNAHENAEEANKIIEGKGSVAIRDAVALNAGASLYVVGLAESIKLGYERALESIRTGETKRKLEEIIEFSGNFVKS